MSKSLLLITLAFFLATLQTNAQFTSVSYSVQAHQDDWQLFMSSRIIADMNNSGTKMVFITLTAGDESCGSCSYGGGGPFYLGRENGSVYSSKFAADLTTGTAPLDVPSATTVSINSHNITKYVYKNTVNYFLRLPDGNLNGNGFPNNNNESLKKLNQGSISSIHAIDGSATYTGWSDLTNTIKAIINTEKITGTQSWIHTAHDNTSTYNINDHSDHTYTSIAAQNSVASGMTWVGVNGFMDYYSSANPANLSATDHANASILFSLEVFGMTESQYQNDYSSGHLGWLPMDLFQVIRSPSGSAPFAGMEENEILKAGSESFAENGLTKMPMVISVTSPASVDKDIMLSISPFEAGDLTTSIYDMAGNKVYELITKIENRDAVILTLKNPVKKRSIYVIKNILNNKYVEERKIIVE